jgi:hypothetical protein
MRRARRIYVAKVAVILSVIPVLVYAFVDGPDSRKTGAPGDSLCSEVGCHLGTANSGPGNVQVTFPGGLTYEPGVTQRLTVTVSDPQAVVFGFQLTARFARDPANGQAGDLEPIDGSTQVLCEDSGLKPCRADAPVQFIEHTLAGTSNTFTFDWSSPATDVGEG